MKSTDVRVISASLYYLPVSMRAPLRFGGETLSHITCCRARVCVQDALGRTAEGWGETPLSVQWAWPADLSLESRLTAMRQFAELAAEAIVRDEASGHVFELSADFQRDDLPRLLDEFNGDRAAQAMPHLAALISFSAIDLAMHDAYGNLHGRPVYETYGPEFLNRDLAAYLTPADDAGVDFTGKYPSDFICKNPPASLPVWHLVGGLDALTPGDAGQPPIHDGYPENLVDWIQADGLACLKIKLKGTDAAWDLHRIIWVAEVSFPLGVDSLSVDFNCTVREPSYVIEILKQLEREHAQIYRRIVYVEQPFPYDLEANPIDVHELSAMKPLFLDESAHDWRLVALGRSLGWNGVCLKTCKSQTGSLLSLCWARAHGMLLMVQDLTNPMMAQIPHVLLAAYAETIRGVESNAMQFYPTASLAEAAVHPGLYARRNGLLDLSSISGSGFGYRAAEIERKLPAPGRHFQR